MPVTRLAKQSIEPNQPASPASPQIDREFTSRPITMENIKRLNASNENETIDSKVDLKPKGKLPILSDAEDVASVANSGILSRNDLKQRAFSIKPSNAVMDAILEQARNKNEPSHNRSGSLSKLSPSLADSDYS